MKVSRGHAAPPREQSDLVAASAKIAVLPARGAAEQNIRASDAVEWEAYPRVTPGEYLAFCQRGKRYRDPGFKRWTCLLYWDVLTPDLVGTVAKGIPMWFALGDGERPRATRRGKYLPEWVRANAGPPSPGDRLSPRIFTRRIARVEIGDANSPVPYSVVKRIICWETGPGGHSVSKSTNQGRPNESDIGERGYEW